jgi:hypothetical protein
MNAKLEPRMVATNTQILAPALHGTSAPFDRITASSPGVLIKGMDSKPAHYAAGTGGILLAFPLNKKSDYYL